MGNSCTTWMKANPRQSIALFIQISSIALVGSGELLLYYKYTNAEGYHNSFYWINGEPPPKNQANFICRKDEKPSNSDTLFNNPRGIAETLVESSVFWGGASKFIICLFPFLIKLFVCFLQSIFFYKRGDCYNKWIKSFGLMQVYLAIGSILTTVPAIPLVQIDFPSKGCMIDNISEYFIIHAKSHFLTLWIFWLVGVMGLLGAACAYNTRKDPYMVVPIFFTSNLEGTAKRCFWLSQFFVYLGLLVLTTELVFMILFICQDYTNVLVIWAIFIAFEVVADVLGYFLPTDDKTKTTTPKGKSKEKIVTSGKGGGLEDLESRQSLHDSTRDPLFEV